MIITIRYSPEELSLATRACRMLRLWISLLHTIEGTDYSKEVIIEKEEVEEIQPFNKHKE